MLFSSFFKNMNKIGKVPAGNSKPFKYNSGNKFGQEIPGSESVSDFS